MFSPRVAEVDASLARLVAWRDRMTAADFYRGADNLLDLRNRVALVAKLEAEHVELVSAQ